MILGLLIVSLNADITNKEFEIKRKEYINEIRPMIYKLSEEDNSAFIFLLKYHAEQILRSKGIKDSKKYWSDFGAIVNIISGLANNQKNQKLYKELFVLYVEIGGNLISQKEMRIRYDRIEGEIKSNINKKRANVVAQKYENKIIYTAKIIHMAIDKVNSNLKSNWENGTRMPNAIANNNFRRDDVNGMVKNTKTNLEWQDNIPIVPKKESGSLKSYEHAINEF